MKGSFQFDTPEWAVPLVEFAALLLFPLRLIGLRVDVEVGR